MLFFTERNRVQVELEAEEPVLPIRHDFGPRRANWIGYYLRHVRGNDDVRLAQGEEHIQCRADSREE